MSVSLSTTSRHGHNYFLFFKVYSTLLAFYASHLTRHAFRGFRSFVSLTTWTSFNKSTILSTSKIVSTLHFDHPGVTITTRCFLRKHVVSPALMPSPVPFLADYRGTFASDNSTFKLTSEVSVINTLPFSIFRVSPCSRSNL